MKKVLIILILCHSLQSELTFKKVLKEQDLDIDSKSYKGWIRIFNDENKRRLYGLDMYDKKTLIQCIKDIKRLQNKELGSEL